MRPSKDTDKLLLNAAKCLFIEKGRLDVSLREIAKKAGVNTGMFYYSFKDKDDFVAQVLQEFYEDFFSALSLDVSLNDSAFENLKQGLIGIGVFASKNHPIFTAVFLGAITGDKIAKKFLTKNFSRHLQILIDLIKQAQKEKKLIKISPFTILTVLMGGLHLPHFVFGTLSKNTVLLNYLHSMGATKETISSQRAIEQRVSIILKGLKPERI